MKKLIPSLIIIAILIGCKCRPDPSVSTIDFGLVFIQDGKNYYLRDSIEIQVFDKSKNSNKYLKYIILDDKYSMDLQSSYTYGVLSVFNNPNGTRGNISGEERLNVLENSTIWIRNRPAKYEYKIENYKRGVFGDCNTYIECTINGVLKKHYFEIKP